MGGKALASPLSLVILVSRRAFGFVILSGARLGPTKWGKRREGSALAFRPLADL